MNRVILINSRQNGDHHRALPHENIGISLRSDVRPSSSHLRLDHILLLHEKMVDAT